MGQQHQLRWVLRWGGCSALSWLHPTASTSVGLWLSRAYLACCVSGETEARRDTGAAATPVGPCSLWPSDGTARGALGVTTASHACLLPPCPACCLLPSACSLQLPSARSPPLHTSACSQPPAAPLAPKGPGREEVGGNLACAGSPWLGSSSSPQPPGYQARARGLSASPPTPDLFCWCQHNFPSAALATPRRGGGGGAPVSVLPPEVGGSLAGAELPAPPDQCQGLALLLGFFLPSSLCLGRPAWLSVPPGVHGETEA